MADVERYLINVNDVEDFFSLQDYAVVHTFHKYSHRNKIVDLGTLKYPTKNRVAVIVQVHKTFYRSPAIEQSKLFVDLAHQINNDQPGQITTYWRCIQHNTIWRRLIKFKKDG